MPNLLVEREPDIFMQDDPNVNTTDEINLKLNKTKVIKNQMSNTKIPLLEDVFKLLTNVPINLDIKINNDTLINKVNELILKYNREDITVRI